MTVETDSSSPDDPPEMSRRTMVLLAGGMSVGVALVLGVTLLVGGDGTTSAARRSAEGAVPAVEGKSVQEATRVLAERRLPVGGVPKVPSSLPAGRIVYTAPPAGTPIAEGSPVTLYVSDGSGGGTADVSRMTVPYLVGVDTGHATRVLEALGLRLDPADAKGVVATQDPAPGTEVAAGTTVKVTVGAPP
ncbi:PASTA domain-containing protein [Actinocorallia sp. API 0066]|uniref:PASTA domain-containing protein n=1 Tax=Actinocorallia sp. API 0066 TaxID=2896846 RepID=UPI001E5AA975|nr:PASTA domain-containing protein [Actinocorallia sp. API 0066]MCD0448710.1 PASTA domain-containing protein [Actinocorallia sp. API 0066]